MRHSHSEMHCLKTQAVHMWIHQEGAPAPTRHLQTCLTPPTPHVQAHMPINSSAPAVQPPTPISQSDNGRRHRHASRRGTHAQNHSASAHGSSWLNESRAAAGSGPATQPAATVSKGDVGRRRGHAGGRGVQHLRLERAGGGARRGRQRRRQLVVQHPGRVHGGRRKGVLVADLVDVRGRGRVCTGKSQRWSAQLWMHNLRLVLFMHVHR